MFQQSIFYIFSCISIFSAFRVVSARDPVRSVFFLVLTFISTAVIWLLAGAEFLALMLIVVYVGAVIVLFLFVVMMLDIDFASLKAKFVTYLPIGIIIFALLLLLLGIGINSHYISKIYIFPKVATSVAENNTFALATLLCTKYLLHIEIAGILLLTAIVAAISLTLRKPRGRKIQIPEQQVKVSKADRLRVLYNVTKD